MPLRERTEFVSAAVQRSRLLSIGEGIPLVVSRLHKHDGSAERCRRRPFEQQYLKRDIAPPAHSQKVVKLPPHQPFVADDRT